MMTRPPLAAGAAIVGDFGRLAREGTVITAGSLATCLWGVARYGAGSAQASTTTFGSLVLGQLLHPLCCRSATRRSFLAAGATLPANPALAGALAVSFGAQAAALLIPGLRRLLGIAPLGRRSISR